MMPEIASASVHTLIFNKRRWDSEP